MIIRNPGGLISGGFMQELERKRTMQQAEEDRRRMGESIRTMFSIAYPGQPLPANIENLNYETAGPAFNAIGQRQTKQQQDFDKRQGLIGIIRQSNEPLYRTIEPKLQSITTPELEFMVERVNATLGRENTMADWQEQYRVRRQDELADITGERAYQETVSEREQKNRLTNTLNEALINSLPEDISPQERVTAVKSIQSGDYDNIPFKSYDSIVTKQAAMVTRSMNRAMQSGGNDPDTAIMNLSELGDSPLFQQLMASIRDKNPELYELLFTEFYSRIELLEKYKMTPRPNIRTPQQEMTIPQATGGQTGYGFPQQMFTGGLGQFARPDAITGANAIPTQMQRILNGMGRMNDQGNIRRSSIGQFNKRI